MRPAANRRDFLRSGLACGTLLSGLDAGFLAGLPLVAAQDQQLSQPLVKLAPDIEPVVQLLENTPRERLLEEVAGRIRDGLAYQQVLAALLLAGVRNIQPRPHVGFKFHAVLVVNSAHLASLGSPPEHRWLPIFWALDHFKEAQADDEREGDWAMGPVDEGRVPAPDKARQAFVAALDNWDADAADVATAALARSARPDEIFELLYRFGARDFRDIGHKAIFVANSRRTLEQIGWEHAEPVLRSLAYALVRYDDQNPKTSDLPADRPWRENARRAAEIRHDWAAGKPDAEATRQLVSTLRTGSADDACSQVVELLNRGVAPQSVWDGLLLGAGELLGRQPGIVSLHAVTSSNALRYAFSATQDDETRRLLLLQNAAFLPLFRQAMQGRGRIGDWSVEQLEAAPTPSDSPAALEEIFATVSVDRNAAAQKTLGYLSAHPDPRELIDAARLLVFFKGNNSHDYKFSSAVLEDWAHLSPDVRARYLAASMFQLRGSRTKDNPLVERTRAALAG